MTELVTTTLREQEAIVERGLASFIEVGNALMRIREERLYQEAGFSGFVEYLESKSWGISRTRSYELIDASRVSAIAETTNEAQARELAPLLRKATPEVVQQVYAEVFQETGGKPTAAVIREKVRETLGHTNGSHPNPTLHDEAMERLEAFLHVARKWTPDLVGRLPQSTCRKQASRIEEAQNILRAIEGAFAPRLDSLPSTRKGVRA